LIIILMLLCFLLLNNMPYIIPYDTDVAVKFIAKPALTPVN
jgi:hypothetical protein